jgi:hypothetical protein
MSGAPMLDNSSSSTLHDVLTRQKDHICEGFPGPDLLLRTFLERWSNNRADNKLWEKIATEAAKGGISRETSFNRIIDSAVTALLVGDAADSISPKDLRAQVKQYQHLARCAQSLADYHLKMGVLSHRDQELSRWYEEQVRYFRSASDEALDDIRFSPRQSRGRKFTQEHIGFMRSLVTDLRRDFGRPFFEAAAAIANIAYRRKDIMAADVREACRIRETQHQIVRSFPRI